MLRAGRQKRRALTILEKHQICKKKISPDIISITDLITDMQNQGVSEDLEDDMPTDIQCLGESLLRPLFF